ncbi:hypothetical protein C7460_101148 [Marinoscillum furvescens DSM 4134]|uniref:Uncharacterized protein n=1 Tax=Marinoscillum furvescens DSM 4134 TaxID=1122208 RepID=A0A3D9LGW1_MARFU|nr:hypothetical protein C7460_101148 [Marinoscillum furvescens DSM 4134]
MIFFSLIISCLAAILYVNTDNMKSTFSFEKRGKWVVVSVVISQIVFYAIYFIFSDLLIEYSESYLRFLFFPIFPAVSAIVFIKALQLISV